MTTAGLRLGIYGGAFDPPHLAHLALARAAIEQHRLDRLLIIPTGHAWHKSRVLSDAAHRLAMAQLAFGDLPAAVIDQREMLRNGASYTIHTLTELGYEHPGAQLFLLMGQDQWAYFEQWNKASEIASIATILVALRAGFMPENRLISLEKALKIESIDESEQMLTAIQALPIQMPGMAISASDIRQRVEHGLPVEHLVNPSVARYIAEHGLYRSAST